MYWVDAQWTTGLTLNPRALMIIIQVDHTNVTGGRCAHSENDDHCSDLRIAPTLCSPKAPPPARSSFCMYLSASYISIRRCLQVLPQILVLERGDGRPTEPDPGLDPFPIRLWSPGPTRTRTPWYVLDTIQ